MNYRFHVERLQSGATTQFRPHGNSMTPRIRSGDLVTVAPIPPDHALRADDIVLCRVRGNFYVHKVVAVRADSVQIGNNHGHINGWTSRSKVYGLVTKVES